MKKYHSIKNMTTSDWGKAALTGLLAGLVPRYDIGEIWIVLLNTATLLGLMSLFIWIYRKIKKI